MGQPSPATVRGDFDNAKFEYYGFRSRFFKKGEEYWVETDGPQGDRKAFKIAYTFGFEPLQQYLIRFPDGRLQALSIAWDTKKRRWFHLHPNEKITAESSLHWTSPQYTWNLMCAECHSTGLRKNYDPARDTYDTTYQELNVACEACHGPASNHLLWAGGEKVPDRGFTANLQGRGPWTPGAGSHPPKPARPGAPTDQIETCARCHSRRSLLSEPYEFGEPLAQTHQVSVLEPDLYHADGQIKEEVFEYGSFLQSKMYHADVVCTDCHDPHTARTRLKGDTLCLQCHQPARYDNRSHSHHSKVSCVDCHMPGKLYMGNDFRRDHSLRIPRPDLSVKLGTPNACATCHQDRSPEWVARAYLKWYGEGPTHYGEVLHAGRAGDPNAAPALIALIGDDSVPEIVRATAVGLVADLQVLKQALQDAHSPLVRREAARALQGAPPETVLQLLLPLATDPVRSVRVEVGRALAGAQGSPPEVLAAVEEYKASLQVSLDSVESRLGKASLYLALGNSRAAEQELQQALKLAPKSPQPYVNLADLYRALGKDAEGRRVLEDGLRRLRPPESAALRHSLGLLLARQQALPAALEQLRLATREQPSDFQFGYVYAVALDSAGNTSAALDESERVLPLRPFDQEVLTLLLSCSQKLGDKKRSSKYRAMLAR